MVRRILESLKKGLISGLTTSWMLTKVIFPVTFTVIFLQFTPVMGWIEGMLNPIMYLVGLPGEAALPLVIGGLLNLYGAIAAIATLSLTVKQVFIIALMLSFSHNLLVEGSVASKVGLSFWKVVGYRIGIAFLLAGVVHVFWQGGQTPAVFNVIHASEVKPDTFIQMLNYSVTKSSLTIFNLILFVVPILVGIQLLKDLGMIKYIEKLCKPILKALKLKENASLPFVAGTVFGLAYGAGVLVSSIEEEPMERKDLWILFIFLSSCHAVIEDTLLFVPLGIPVLALLLIRVVVAFALSWIISMILTWNESVQYKRGETYENNNRTF